jgi:hypothetical protein
VLSQKDLTIVFPYGTMRTKYGLILFHPPGKMGGAESWWAVLSACGFE